MTVYYLAGPMSGVPEFNFPAFDEACRKMRGRGLVVASPHEIDYGETLETRGTLSHQVYMRRSLRLLAQCDVVILLPGWERSRGVAEELNTAKTLEMYIREYEVEMRRLG